MKAERTVFANDQVGFPARTGIDHVEHGSLFESGLSRIFAGIPISGQRRDELVERIEIRIDHKVEIVGRPGYLRGSCWRVTR